MIVVIGIVGISGRCIGSVIGKSALRPVRPVRPTS